LTLIRLIKEKLVKYFNIVREKSKFILSLLEDKEKLKDERKNFARWKARIEGVSNSGKITSVGSNDIGNSVSKGTYASSSYLDKPSDNKSKKKPVKEESSSSESEEEKPKKKSKKTKKLESESESEEEKPKKSKKHNDEEKVEEKKEKVQLKSK
jgi:hypothetical protein